MGWEQRKPTPEEWAQAEKEAEERKAVKSAEETMKEKAAEAGVSDEQKVAREARGEEQRVLDEKAAEEQMRAIDALDENPLEQLADEAKKEDSDVEKAA